ncbi:MAG: hypothetical protein H7641_01680 [Candidatus Heimdallarchaeota archaeon]|nr:hypothetical protein [Candidatus Heimdallarchaeota archaeon]MCK4876273.1 hypothetical protein [Candidatus Heimdallarchaeota archaeon]
MTASTIQKTKIIQAFDNVLDNYEVECVYTKDLEKILDQVAEIVTSSTTDNDLSPGQRLYSRSTIQEQVRASKNQAVVKYLMFRGSLS